MTGLLIRICPAHRVALPDQADQLGPCPRAGLWPGLPHGLEGLITVTLLCTKSLSFRVIRFVHWAGAVQYSLRCGVLTGRGTREPCGDARVNSTVAVLAHELALVARATAEPAAFAAIYGHYFPRVYNYVRYRVGAAVAADDITAQTFERALVGIGRYAGS